MNRNNMHRPIEKWRMLLKKQVNVLAIDVESWLHKYFLDYDSITKNKKDAGYIRDSILDTLKIFQNHDVKTTFFIISEVFDWHPEAIYKIKDMGHEIAFHTHSHRRLLRKKDLLEELKKGKKFMDEFDTKGFRAPQAVIKREYLPILRDWGFVYDSSIYSEFKIFEPIDGILEVPISTYPLFKTHRPVHFPSDLTISLLIREIPFGSGYFIGLLGPNVGWFINKLNKKNIPTSLTAHSYQIYQIRDMPKGDRSIEGGIFERLKMIPYNVNRRDTIDYLLRNYDFIPMINFINTIGYDNKIWTTK
jgi:peptidoglycan/xylan/chitin deacetylase (PgdA/CDA1 family)